MVFGDQADKTTVDDWVVTAGGNFNVIVDDGGYKNDQIKNSFDILFPKALLPGGLYFIEDLQVSRITGFANDGVPVMADVIQSYIDQLLIPTHYLTDKRSTLRFMSFGIGYTLRCCKEYSERKSLISQIMCWNQELIDI